MNYIIDRIFSRLGSKARKIFLDEVDAATVIVNETIPTYSKYFPWECLHKIKESDVVPNSIGMYYLDDLPTPIININRISLTIR